MCFIKINQHCEKKSNHGIVFGPQVYCLKFLAIVCFYIMYNMTCNTLNVHCSISCYFVSSSLLDCPIQTWNSRFITFEPLQFLNDLNFPTSTDLMKSLDRNCFKMLTSFLPQDDEPVKLPFFPSQVMITDIWSSGL